MNRGWVFFLALFAQAVFAFQETSPWRLFQVNGFLDLRAGTRTGRDPYEGQSTLGELRGQLDLSGPLGPATLQIRTDLLFDNLADQGRVDLETGGGWLDLREANLSFSPFSLMDVKLGRQILTWGTGDLVFINDLFPKDWESFFAGRETAYLKAPSDALFVGLFPVFSTVELAYIPRFDADRYLSGRRFSYWNPVLGRLAGEDAPISADPPSRWTKDDEWHLRISRTLGAYELAAYAYRGFWKSPQGLDPQTQRPVFPRLAVYGASLRGPLGKGLFSWEGGYYDSPQFQPGDSGPPGEIRALLAYEREIARHLSAGVQYYLERWEGDESYLEQWRERSGRPHQTRSLFTLRLTSMLRRDNVKLSLFAYASPSDDDGYLRPSFTYKLNDLWQLGLGGNLFYGRDERSFFGQLEHNDNLYLAVRFTTSLKD